MQNTPTINVWPHLPLEGYVLFITGGAQGIGRGIAHSALGAGAKVVLGDRDEAALEACLKELNVGVCAFGVVLDVTKPKSVQAAFQQALMQMGRMDGLVNNAGVADPHLPPLDEATWEDWQRGLSSLNGAFLCTQAALPSLRASGRGAIVNIASTRAHQSEVHSEAYAAAKSGLLGFSHALAVSEGPAIRVNAITPGWIETSDWQAPPKRQAPVHRDIDRSQHPAGRVGVPQDIGALAVFLLGPQAGFITGQEFIVDGGMTKKMIYAE